MIGIKEVSITRTTTTLSSFSLVDSDNIAFDAATELDCFTITRHVTKHEAQTHIKIAFLTGQPLNSWYVGTGICFVLSSHIMLKIIRHRSTMVCTKCYKNSMIIF